MLRIYKGISMEDRFIRDRVYEILTADEAENGIMLCVCDELNRIRTLYYRNMAECRRQWKAPCGRT